MKENAGSESCEENDAGNWFHWVTEVSLAGFKFESIFER